MGTDLVRCCSIGFHLVPTSLGMGSGPCAGAAAAIAQDVPQGLLPNLPEVLLEQVRLDRAQVQLELASLTAVHRSLQQRAANALGRLQALLLECAHPGRAQFVDHLSEVACDMQSVQHAPRLPGPCADHRQGGVARVPGAPPQLIRALFAQPLEKASSISILRSSPTEAVGGNPYRLGTARSRSGGWVRFRARAREAANRHVDAPGITEGRETTRDPVQASPRSLRADDSARTRSAFRIVG